MKKQYIFTILLASALLTACSTTPSTNNADSHTGMNHNAENTPASNDQPVDHSKMDHGAMDHSTMKSSPNAASAEYDLQFIDTMIAHHQSAVDMARLIPAKADNAELKKLGQNIVSSQEKEIAAMRAWRERWFGGKPEALNMEMAGMKNSMSGMDMKKLDALNGKPFDLEFIKQMIPHHEGAVVMAKEALQKSRRDEIKNLATSIIRDQTAEIDMMKTWLKDWVK